MTEITAQSAALALCLLDAALLFLRGFAFAPTPSSHEDEENVSKKENLIARSKQKGNMLHDKFDV